ncbi:MAG TPA: hypothetical protein VLQ93_06505, partial [Myxococcaceae bacterium]|nr:hypothetical protein [Myxococcaceae bacterium]
MAINKAGRSSSTPKPKPAESKSASKPASTTKTASTTASNRKPASANTASTTKASTAASQASTTRNTVRPQARDGFESAPLSTSSQRGQLAERLGSTTAAVAPASTGGAANPGALARIGLTENDLRTAGAAARPNLERAATAALQGQHDQALTELRNAALASPEIAQKAIKGLAQNLPEGPAKTLLSDDKVAKELVTNNELHASIGKLIKNPSDTGAIRELLGNDKARDAALGALSNDPTVKANLAKVGLAPSDLLEAGKAAPKVWDMERRKEESPKMDAGGGGVNPRDRRELERKSN